MSRQLKASQANLSEQMSDVEGVGGRVETDVHADRATRQSRTEGVTVGRVVQQSSRLEFSEQIHAGDLAMVGADSGHLM